MKRLDFVRQYKENHLLTFNEAYHKKLLFSVNENQESFYYIPEQILEAVLSRKI